MRKLTIFLMALICVNLIYAQTPAQFISQAEVQIAKRNETGALDFYKQALLKDRTNVNALLGASLMCSRSGDKLSTAEQKKAIFSTAKTFAVEAMRLAPNNAESYYVLAVAMGRLALMGSPKEKIAASRDIKKYIDKCVTINPNHAHAWHVIGRYNQAISELNFAEKSAANLLFGGLPKGDLNTAITSFEKCKALDPTYILNILDMAKAYKQKGNSAKAKEYLNSITNLPLRTYDDPKHKLEAKQMLSGL